MEYPVRVLHVIGSMNRGGAETMIMNYYRNIDRSKVQFDFVENTFEPAAFDDEIRELGGRIYNCPHYNGKNHFAYKKWWHDFFKEHSGEYRIIHGHIGSTAAIYLAIAKKYGLYTIAHSHSTDAVKSLNDFLYSAYSFPTRFVADRLFACSKDAGIARYGNKHGKNAIVINNAIDVKHFSYDANKREQMRKDMNIEDMLVAGHVGRFMDVKNHEFLIDVFNELHKKNEKSVLLLVGGGPLENHIKEKVDALELSDVVFFAGVQSDTSGFYQAMDVFCMPSLYEGMPVTMVEAQAASLPCVVSDRIPSECNITSLVTMVELEKSAEDWADIIIAKSNDKNRKDMIKDITNAGYDIKENAWELKKLYLEIISNAK